MRIRHQSSGNESGVENEHTTRRDSETFDVAAPEAPSSRTRRQQLKIYTAINFTSYSVTEVGALSACGWLGVRVCATARVVGSRYGGKWAWLAGRGRCTASTPEWLAGRNGSVRLDWERSTAIKSCSHFSD